MNTAPGWTEQRIAQMTRLFHEGVSCSQIARQLGGLSRNAVIGKLHRLGLTRPKRAGFASASAQRPRMTPWTPEKVAMLRDLWSRPGMTREQVAAALGPTFTIHALANKAAQLGLPDRPKGGARPRLVYGGNNQIMDAGADRPPIVPPPRSGAFRALPGTTPRSFADRRFDECAWPIMDPADTDDIARLSCCAQRTDNSPYCRTHAALGRSAVGPKAKTSNDLTRSLRRYL
jgi:GcrA cell cycle regulator